MVCLQVYRRVLQACLQNMYLMLRIVFAVCTLPFARDAGSLRNSGAMGLPLQKRRGEHCRLTISAVSLRELRALIQHTSLVNEQSLMMFDIARAAVHCCSAN